MTSSQLFKRTASPFLALTLLLATAWAEGAPVHGIAMHGAPKYGPDFQHFDYADPNAPKGGEFREAEIGTFDNLNPFILKGISPAGIGSLFDTLMTGSEDEAFTEYGLLAETVEVAPDRSWVEFKLRAEARFHDGKPVTPDDVIHTFELLMTDGHPFYKAYYGSVKKVEKTGDRTVRFLFPDGSNPELPLIVGQLPVLPKHYWETRKFGETTLEPPLGSGPYRIASFEAGRSIVYERVKDYWGKDLPVNRGRFNFDRMRNDYYRDTTVALEAFKAGAFDLREENVSKNWATAYDIPAVREGKIRKEEILHERPTGMQAFVFNTRRTIFSDRRVRQALAYAFDFEWTNRNLFYSAYTRTKSYFSNSELASQGLPSAKELELLTPFRDQLPQEVFTETYDPPATDGSGNLRGQTRTALRLLKAAGWEVRDNKLVNVASGEQMKFEILLAQPTFERIVLPFTRNLERLGIEATVRTVDASQYENRVNDFDFDMIVGGFGQSLSPGNEQRDFWSSTAAKTQGSRNVIGISDPVVDALIEKVIAAPDREALITATRALDRVLLWGHYVIPHWHVRSFRVAYWDRFGRPDVSPKYSLGLTTWWLDRAKADRLKGSLNR